MKLKAKDSFVVKNKKGLHTRPSTTLMKCASSFRSKVTLRCQNSTVNAKSLLGILTLAAARGSKIRVEAIGEDAEEAVKTIVKLATDEFNIRY